VNDTDVGGLLSRKAGVTHFNVGGTETRLKLLHQLIDDFHTPAQCIYASQPVESTRTDQVSARASKKLLRKKKNGKK